MRKAIATLYTKLRRDGWHSAQALRAARITYAFRRRDAGEFDQPDAVHCVRLRREPDDCADFEDLCGDMFNPRANPGIRPSKLARDRKAYAEEVNRDGVWGCIAAYWDAVDEEWKDADAVWGFVGQAGHGYEFDLMQSALDARTASVRRWRAMCKAAP